MSLNANPELLGYAGPGLGLGAIAILIGLFTSIVLALFALVWYPFKRLLRLFRKKPNAAEESAPVDPT